MSMKDTENISKTLKFWSIPVRSPLNKDLEAIWKYEFQMRFLMNEGFWPFTIDWVFCWQPIFVIITLLDRRRWTAIFNGKWGFYHNKSSFRGNQASSFEPLTNPE